MTATENATGQRLGRLAPIKPSPRSEPELPRSEPSTAKLASLQPVSLSTRRVLDFDLESVNAGFEDPQWTPVTVTCWAFCWVDDVTTITVEALPPADFYNKEARRRFLLPLLAAIEQSDVLTFHNGIKYDLPVLNGECMKLGLPTLGPKLAQDTMRIPRARFKKGQDNMAHALGVKEEKLPLSWAEWAAAYAEPDLATVKERCASDVLMHIQMRERMREEKWLKPPRLWNP